MRHSIQKRTLLAVALLFAAGCGAEAPESEEVACPGPDCPACPGPECVPTETDDGKADNADGYNALNFAAGTMALYEVQVRTANACDPSLGAAWQRSACKAKVAPTIPYRGEGMSCDDLPNLERIKLGTLEDMVEDTADYRAGITVRYVNERVGANALWLMPLFPNNDAWALPAACDNLGSPYAVRDYMHAAGTLSRACIRDGRDEYSEEPCWGTESLEKVIGEAHRRGMRVMLDLAFNHFGHNYLMYDYQSFRPERARIAAGEDLNRLWDYEGTYDEGLLHPAILDTPEALDAVVAKDAAARADLAALDERCPDLEGDARVRAFNTWRVALDWERDQFECDGQVLEIQAPGFYLGSDHQSPSRVLGDNFSNEWRDVKFLFHHEENRAHTHEFVRQREYLFRVLNYWVSRGVDGFRLDHTTDYHGGMGSKEWDYILSKVDYYAWKRGQQQPGYLAEEFGDQMEMNKVVDIMTEGYVGDMTGRNGRTKDTSYVERIVDNMGRFGGHTYVMTALETHDEHRLLDHTGFDIWTGAGFWGIGATTWSTPMLLMGQEFGEPWGLAFRKSDFLRSRFEGTDQYNTQGDALVNFYGAMLRARFDARNRALLASDHAFLRTRDGNKADQRIFAQAKWSGDGSVVLALHNLWNQDVAQSYYIPNELAAALGLRDSRRYKLVDALGGKQVGDCRTGADLKWDFYVSMDRATRLQWLRLETCD